MYNAIPMQKRWVYTAASLPHPTGLTFHEKGLHFRSDSSGSSLHGTGRRADVGVPSLRSSRLRILFQKVCLEDK